MLPISPCLLQNDVEQSREDGIADPDERAHDSYSYADDTGVGHEFAFGAPRYLFHFGDDFAHELLQNYFTSLLPVLCLLRFFMKRVFLAELAILIELQTIRVVLLVLVGAVVAAMALRALQRDIVAHYLFTPLTLRSILPVGKCHPYNLA